MNGQQTNVQYVLLAEFDIDKGSTVRHQYPKPCPISENILADLMLPEGAHLREQDWTYFFLRESEKQNKVNEKRRVTKVDKWERNRQELIDSINNNTFNVQVLEFSESVSDWFIMHDVAKCKFIYDGKWEKSDIDVPEITIKITEIDKPSNIISAVVVNVDLQWTVLSETELFCSFYPPHGNAIGIKFEKFKSLKICTDIVQQVTEPTKRPELPKEENNAAVVEVEDINLAEQIVVLNLVRTQKDKSVKRGAVVKAIAIATRLRILDTFKPLLTLALDDYYRTESEDVLKNLYNTLNDVSFDPNSHLHSKSNRYQLMEQKEQREDLSNFTVSIKFHGINMRLTAPKTIGPDEITGVSMRKLFKTFRRNNGMSIIYNALFTQRRVIFVGHNLPSDLIANMVLSACLLISPAIPGTIKRAYPYACLTAMQFLQVSGYIAGVTNPIFEQRQEWWDVLCNVATGDVTLSESYERELNDETTQPLYKKVQSIDKILINEIRNGLQLKYGEKYIRSMFQDYTDHIVKIALDLEVFENDDIRKHDLSVNEWRINAWRNTDSFLTTMEAIESKNIASPFKGRTKEFNLMVRTIQIKPLQPDKARTYLAKIDHWLDSKEKIKYFINTLNPSLGHKVLQYMFHSDEFISGKALDIALKLESYSKQANQVNNPSMYLEEANKIMKSLNFFYIVTFERLKLERKAGLRKQKQLKRKLQSNDIHTGKIEYGDNIHKVVKQTSNREVMNKLRNNDSNENNHQMNMNPMHSANNNVNGGGMDHNSNNNGYMYSPMQQNNGDPYSNYPQ